MKYVNWANLRYLTGFNKEFANVTNEVLRDLDLDTGGELTKYIKVLRTKVGGPINIPPGAILIQYDKDSRNYATIGELKLGRVNFEAFDNGKYGDLLDQCRQRYSNGSLWTLGFVIKGGEKRTIISAPLGIMLRSGRDISSCYQVYSHEFVHDCNGESISNAAYIGVTKRGWRIRWQEHLNAATRGSRYRFHEAIRRWGNSANTVIHNVIACGQTETDAMAIEEEMVGFETLYPRGLNMIPGGYAGLKYLHQIGAVSDKEHVTPDDKHKAIDRFFESASRKGLPNPLAAANWCDQSYAERVICGGDDRLKPDQIHIARFLSSVGKTDVDIADAIGARNLLQVRRLLRGNTYLRVG